MTAARHHQYAAHHTYESLLCEVLMAGEVFSTSKACSATQARALGCSVSWQVGQHVDLLDFF